MNIEGITLREAVADDLDAIALIYNSLWCNWIRKAGAWEDWALCGRFNAAMQLQRSPITLMAERNGAVVGARLVGVFENGAPVRNPRWQPVYEELLAKGHRAGRDRRRGPRGVALRRLAGEGHGRPLSRPRPSTQSMYGEVKHLQ